MQSFVRFTQRAGAVLAVVTGLLLAACDGKDFHVSGEVGGLVGTGLVLLNNGEDTVRVNSNGTFEFDYAYPFAYPYLVTVGVQPVAPEQTCIVSNGSGMLMDDVHDVRVDCRTKYTVSGVVTGLQGTGLVLQNAGSDNLTITAGGDFEFATSLVDGSAYNVSVLSQPSGQDCEVANGIGVIDGANITDVQIICGTLTVGGTVSGLSGTLVLQNQFADDLTLTANGSFTFATAQTEGDAYEVAVLTQPTGQRCSVTNGAGTFAGVDVTNVQVTCSYTVGGAVTGLEDGVSVTLQNNGDDDRVIFLDSDFTFDTVLDSGDTYDVTVAVLPSRQSCTVTSGTGTITAAGITNVAVACRLGPTVAVDYGIKRLILNWDRVETRVVVNGAVVVTPEFYRVMKSTDAGLTYSQISAVITDLSYVDTLPVHLTDWARLVYKVQSCSNATDTATCNDSNTVTGFDEIETIAYAKASNTGEGDNFGYTVAVSGDGNTLAVGAVLEDSAATGVDDTSPGESDDSALNSGAVYVYVRDVVTGLWSQQAYIKASNSAAQDNFGAALALAEDGNTLAVGAPGEDSAATGINNLAPGEGDNSASASGAAYVFVRSGDDWTQQAYVKASNTGTQDNFGYAVSLSDDGATLAVGAYFEDSAATGIDGNAADNAATNSGAVYLFEWDGAAWGQDAYVKASNTGAGDQFGNALSLSGDGDTLAVGARAEDSSAQGVGGLESDNAALESGAVYVFTRTLGGWGQEEYLKASNAGAGDLFGNALALSDDGDTLAVAAYLEDSTPGSVAGVDNNVLDSGAAYVFARSGTAWSQQTFVKAENLESGDQFGASLALSATGDVLVLGASLEDGGTSGIDGNQLDNLADGSGAAYVFTRDDSVWAEQQYVKASNTEQGDSFGYALSLSDDGNTLAVGAIQEDSAATGAGGDQDDNEVAGSGAVYLY